MLQLHDRMKEDTAYQSAAPQLPFDFPPGSAWMAFTDQVSHAAMSGQHQLEQTFLLPVGAMLDEARSPLRRFGRGVSAPTHLSAEVGCLPISQPASTPLTRRLAPHVARRLDSLPS
jgi:hypothetical protein